MKAKLEDLGHTSHQEALLVFAVVGVVLGSLAATFELWGFSSKPILNIATEALSLSIFSVLCALGLIGLIVASWSGTPALLRRVLYFACLPTLRAGLSAGFIASGMTMGFGLGGLLMFKFFGSTVQIADALRLIALGTVLLLVVWPFIYLGAEALSVAGYSLKAVAVFYSVGMSAVLLLAVPLGFWAGVAICVTSSVFGYWLMRRKSARGKAQQALQADGPASCGSAA